MFFIASKNPNGSYSIEDVVDDWHKIIDSSEPIDVIDEEIIIFNELGKKYLVGPNKKLEYKKLFGRFNFLSSVEVGQWDFKKGEPYLIEVSDVNRGELKVLLLDYVKKREIILQPHQDKSVEGLLLAVAHSAAVSKMPSNIVKAHAHSSQHREEILASNICGCFYCLKTFSPSEIEVWIDDDNTALCPKCGIDSVIGDKSGYPISQKFLVEMQGYWF